MSKRVANLPIPNFYKEVNAQSPSYEPDRQALQQAAIDWRKQFSIKPVGSDKVKIHLLIIDAQRDFGFPSGALYVAGRSGTGAMDDHDRLAKFIYRYLELLSQMTCTMDTHLPYQIFHSIAHLNKDGEHPAPYTMISTEDYRKANYRPNPAMAAYLKVSPVWLQKQFVYYCEQLEKTGKYALTIWPYHEMLGSPGHSLVGIIEEARLFHSFARGAANIPEIKGGNPLTEHYSIFKPEVTTCWDGNSIPQAQKNTTLIKTLMESDAVIITGQARSHCVAWSIDDFLTEIVAVDQQLAKKVYLLEDCSSAVVIPGVIDFTEQADEAYQRFANAGMNVVKSTDPIGTWPGMAQKLAI